MQTSSKRVIQQRKRIAKDVIAQLDSGRAVAKVGCYLNAPHAWFLNLRNAPPNTPLTIPTCTACAVGNLFIAALDRYNGVTCDDLVYRAFDDVMVRKLERWWSPWTVRLIEVAFEGSVISYPSGLTEAERDRFDRAAARAEKWGDKFGDNPDKCLRAICHKIIRSVDGDFRV